MTDHYSATDTDLSLASYLWHLQYLLMRIVPLRTLADLRIFILLYRPQAGYNNRQGLLVKEELSLDVMNVRDYRDNCSSTGANQIQWFYV